MPLAVESRVLLGIGVLVGLALFAGVLVLTALPPRRRRALIPIGKRPGPGDEALERRILDRYIAWGAVLTVFMAVFLPALLVAEDWRMNRKDAQFAERSVERGRAIYGEVGLVAVNCARCHGREGEGGVQPATAGGAATNVAVPPLDLLFARYKAAGRNDDEIRQLVRDAIERGRPGTIMPTWGLPFGGPLNSQQVDDLINFIVAIQVPAPAAPTAGGAQLFAQNCAICHGPNGEGGVGPNLQVALERNSAEQLAEIISRGRLNTNRYSMPAWAHLGKDAVDALVAFIAGIQRSA